MPVPKASHSIKKASTKLGSAKTGGLETTSFSFSKATWASFDHLKEFFFSRPVNEEAIKP